MMRQFLALVLVAVMALMPMSVLAGHTASPSPEAQEMPCHSHDGAQPDQDSKNSCGDMKHCCGGFLAAAIADNVAAPAAHGSARPYEPLRAGFVPDQLDPPPVVL